MHFSFDKEPDVVGFVPKEMFFTKGVGKHREKLTSFELALRSAGIAACNLVRVSSIFPPGCRIMSRSEGIKRLKPGQVTFVVMSEAATREPQDRKSTRLNSSHSQISYAVFCLKKKKKKTNKSIPQH